jgi:hypothetical protein
MKTRRIIVGLVCVAVAYIALAFCAENYNNDRQLMGICGLMIAIIAVPVASFSLLKVWEFYFAGISIGLSGVAILLVTLSSIDEIKHPHQAWFISSVAMMAIGATAMMFGLLRSKRSK